MFSGCGKAVKGERCSLASRNLTCLVYSLPCSNSRCRNLLPFDGSEYEILHTEGKYAFSHKLLQSYLDAIIGGLSLNHQFDTLRRGFEMAALRYVTVCACTYGDCQEHKAMLCCQTVGVFLLLVVLTLVYFSLSRMRRQCERNGLSTLMEGVVCKPPSNKTIAAAILFFLRLMRLDYDGRFCCQVCGPNPVTIVMDAVARGFRRMHVRYRPWLPTAATRTVAVDARYAAH